MRSIVADCVGVFFWISEILVGIHKSFETVIGVEIVKKKVRAP